ncbi:MAG: hypothetical protein QM736_23050 [Vicinamibacterales bacterium]
MTALPAANGGPNTIFRLSRAATLVGLDLPPQSANIRSETVRDPDRYHRPPAYAATQQRHHVEFRR